MPKKFIKLLKTIDSKLSKCYYIQAFGILGGVAQLGEHLLCKQGVSGSIPLISTTPNHNQNNGIVAQLVRARD